LPLRCIRSMRLMPNALILTSASPALGVGTGSESEMYSDEAGPTEERMATARMFEGREGMVACVFVIVVRGRSAVLSSRSDQVRMGMGRARYEYGSVIYGSVFFHR
jgi:hypothetical protein